MSRNLVLFLIICGLGVGAILVYAKNNMTTASKPDVSANLSKTSDKAAEPNNQNYQTNPQQVLSSVDQKTSNQSNTQYQNQNQTQDQVQQQNPQKVQEVQQPVGSNSKPQSLSPYSGQVTQLEIKDIAMGNGQEVKTGDNVAVNYIGTFLDGSKFDSSYDRNQTFSFNVGAGNVIKGWDMGLIGMKVGGKRLLIIPSDLAYGANGAPGAIPPNTPLMFEIELVSVNSSQ